MYQCMLILCRSIPTFDHSFSSKPIIVYDVIHWLSLNDVAYNIMFLYSLHLYQAELSLPRI